MKSLVSTFSFLVAVWWTGVLPANAQQVNVTQEHNNVSRDGVYIDSAFTPSAAANLVRDLGFDGTISGNVYAQPLYIDDGPNGRPTIIAVTESNNVTRLMPQQASSSGRVQTSVRPSQIPRAEVFFPLVSQALR